MHPKRKTIGLRVPDSPIAQALLEELGEPMMSVTLILPGDDYPLSDPYDIRAAMEAHVDVIVDARILRPGTHHCSRYDRPAAGNYPPGNR